MANKKSAKEQKEDAGNGEVLQKAAKAVGTALGTLAAKTGVAEPKRAGEPKPPKKRKKLESKGKKRLPRKEKKKLQKQAGAAQSQ